MTRLRVDQLPPSVRERVAEAAGQPARPKKSRKGQGLSVACTGHCGCGQRFESAARWEAHAKAMGCSRWSIDLTPVTP